MPKCRDCRHLAPNLKGTSAFKCQAKKCGATKMTPDTDASGCKKFEKK